MKFGFIADFYCRKLKTVLEVDGSSHRTKEGADYDRKRDAAFRSRGIKTIRLQWPFTQKCKWILNELLGEAPAPSKIEFESWQIEHLNSI